MKGANMTMLKCKASHKNHGTTAKMESRRIFGLAISFRTWSIDRFSAGD